MDTVKTPVARSQPQYCLAATSNLAMKINDTVRANGGRIEPPYSKALCDINSGSDLGLQEASHEHPAAQQNIIRYLCAKKVKLA